MNDAMTPTPAQMREDLAFLRDEWSPLDRSFSTAERREFNAIVAAAMDTADSLSPAAFELRVMRAVAVARNGHTSVRSLLRFLPPLPLRAWWFADGLHVVSAAPDLAHLLGARIDALGEITADNALAAVAPIIAGTPQRVRYLSAFYLMSAPVLHWIGAIDSPEAAAITFRLRDGSTRELNLRPAATFDPAFTERPYFGYSALIPGDATLPGRWPHVLDNFAPPLAYGKPTDLFSAWIGPREEILYIRSNDIRGSDESPLDRKLQRLLSDEVVPRRPQHAIIDLRLNQGGNFFNTILFTQALPRLLPPDGKICVLVGRATFSAALVTAAMLKANGGDRTLVIGETMGDADRFWAEGGNKTLPHSKIDVRYSDGFHDWEAGCTDLDTCYWPAVAFGVRNISLAPALHIEPCFAGYAAARDPVLEAALAIAR
jgi:hypothetical protein